MIRYFLKISILTLLLTTNSYSEIIKKIIINGNERISTETIKMFSSIQEGDDINNKKLNELTKNLFDTNFFEDIETNFSKGLLNITVKENRIIQNINFNGVKSKNLKEEILKDVKLKERTSFSDYLLEEDKEIILKNLRNLGYFFSNVDVFVNKLEDNRVDLDFEIKLGDKSKIEKIIFLGNENFKDNKLRGVIISEENKFWKFLSNKKYLNKNIIDLDKNLLTNFYLNKGFYNIKVSSTFAKINEKGNFELIYNINPNKKYYFDNLKLILPVDFDKNYYKSVNDLFIKLKGKPYSVNSIEKILQIIETISIQEEYQSIKSTVEENIIDNKINLIFEIKEAEKYFVNQINIFGNNVTQENVIRNQLEIDEGDPYNDILAKKSINSIKSLGFFKKVSDEIITNESNKTKTINIRITEKPTGEILAGAGIGTSGGTATFSIKENNYLGKGIGLQMLGTVDEKSIKGKFVVTNPNFRNSDKTVRLSIEALETDLLTTSGYKSNKTGFSLGTNFEYLDDLNVGIGQSSFYERISTNSTASARQKLQKGDYWDTFIKIDADFDKRNQKYQTSDGFRSFYSADIPVISKTNTFTNMYSYTLYNELYDNNLSSVSLYAKTANSLTGDDVKLSERLFLPGSKLRGFEQGKIGPKDGKDFIGGNFISSINFNSTIPQILPNSQNTNFLLFLDIANIWGVDYDSSLDSSNKIRSSVGIGIDLFTVLGPLNFSLSQPLSKAKTDKTETFRFNLGTTF